MERPRKRRYNEASTVVIESSEWAELPAFTDSGYSGSSDDDVQVVPPRSTEADERAKTDAIERLKRKVAELTAELEATKTELQATKNELGQSKLQLQSANISLGLEKHRSTQLEQSFKDAQSSITGFQKQAQAAAELTPIFGICRCEFAATSLHYDFRQAPVTTVAASRGGFAYIPPYGSYRYALQVRGKYDDGDSWLGNQGLPGEWQVAYHGTNYKSLSLIIRNGFHLSKGQRMAFGKGIYCSPDPSVAMAYALPFTEKGKKCRAVLQVRVDPSRRTCVSKDNSGREYWLVPDGTAIRPYGLCIYEGP